MVVKSISQYYYGARYYDPKTSVFLGIDPKADEYSAWSPYTYCLNNPIRLIDVDGAEPGSHNLNQGVFFIQHPFKAMQIGYNNGSNNISSRATRFSLKTKLSEDNTKMGTPMNGYRHTLWQASISAKFGNTIAKMAGYAHEDNPSAANLTKDPSGMIFKGKDALSKADEVVDLLNDAIGQQIGDENPGANMKNLSLIVLDKAKDEGLWTATKQKDGAYKINKTKISNSEYQKAREALIKADTNGN